MCFRCYVAGRGRTHASDRTQRDWSYLTDPLAEDAIDTGTLREQFNGISRRAIRAFRASGEEFATLVEDIPAGMVQETIGALGLDAEMYAEQRDGTTVLRRIPSTEVSRGKAKHRPGV